MTKMSLGVSGSSDRASNSLSLMTEFLISAFRFSGFLAEQLRLQQAFSFGLSLYS
jgi:hypothetical protein